MSQDSTSLLVWLFTGNGVGKTVPVNWGEERSAGLHAPPLCQPRYEEAAVCKEGAAAVRKGVHVSVRTEGRRSLCPLVPGVEWHAGPQ